mgnify:CR=1 FL=1
MLRFTPLSLLAFVFVFATAQSARADVVVNGPSDTSSQTVIKTTPPTVIVVKQKAPPPPPPKKRERKVGLHADFGGTFGPEVTMGGFSGALRFRPKEYLGIDLGSGYFVGNDYQGFDRSEIPVTANVLFFVNPQHKLQVYFLLGPGPVSSTHLRAHET